MSDKKLMRLWGVGLCKKYRQCLQADIPDRSDLLGTQAHFLWWDVK